MVSCGRAVAVGKPGWPSNCQWSPARPAHRTRRNRRPDLVACSLRPRSARCTRSASVRNCSQFSCSIWSVPAIRLSPTPILVGSRRMLPSRCSCRRRAGERVLRPWIFAPRSTHVRRQQLRQTDPGQSAATADGPRPTTAWRCSGVWFRLLIRPGSEPRKPPRSARSTWR